MSLHEKETTLLDEFPNFEEIFSLNTFRKFKKFNDLYILLGEVYERTIKILFGIIGGKLELNVEISNIEFRLAKDEQSYKNEEQYFLKEVQFLEYSTKLGINQNIINSKTIKEEKEINEANKDKENKEDKKTQEVKESSEMIKEKEIKETKEYVSNLKGSDRFVEFDIILTTSNINNEKLINNNKISSDVNYINNDMIDNRTFENNYKKESFVKIESSNNSKKQQYKSKKKSKNSQNSDYNRSNFAEIEKISLKDLLVNLDSSICYLTDKDELFKNLDNIMCIFEVKRNLHSGWKDILSKIPKLVRFVNVQRKFNPDMKFAFSIIYNDRFLKNEDIVNGKFFEVEDKIQNNINNDLNMIVEKQIRFLNSYFSNIRISFFLLYIPESVYSNKNYYLENQYSKVINSVKKEREEFEEKFRKEQKLREEMEKNLREEMEKNLEKLKEEMEKKLKKEQLLIEEMKQSMNDMEQKLNKMMIKDNKN